MSVILPHPRSRQNIIEITLVSRIVVGVTGAVENSVDAENSIAGEPFLQRLMIGYLQPPRLRNPTRLSSPLPAPTLPCMASNALFAVTT